MKALVEKDIFMKKQEKEMRKAPHFFYVHLSRKLKGTRGSSRELKGTQGNSRELKETQGPGRIKNVPFPPRKNYISRCALGLNRLHF